VFFGEEKKRQGFGGIWKSLFWMGHGKDATWFGREFVFLDGNGSSDFLWVLVLFVKESKEI
jgi:hypothetical protein